MNIKPKTNDSPELTKYKLNTIKKEHFKNIIITVLVSSILAFILGFVVSSNLKSNEIKLEKENTLLKIENKSIQQEISQLKEQPQNK